MSFFFFFYVSSLSLFTSLRSTSAGSDVSFHVLTDGLTIPEALLTVAPAVALTVAVAVEDSADWPPELYKRCGKGNRQGKGQRVKRE